MRIRRRGWRWLVRGLLGLIAILALGVGAAVLAMHTHWGREVLRAQVEQRLQGMFIGGATLGGVDGTPFGEMTLHDLVIHGPDAKPAISVKTLTVQVGLMPLMSHQARVVGVVAEDVDIDLKRDPDGRMQIARLMKPGPSSGWSVQLPSVALRRAHLRVDTGREVMNFDGLTLDGRATLPHGGPVDASVELTGTWRERGAAGLDLQTVVHSGDQGVVVPYLRARAGDISLLGHSLTVRSENGGLVVGGLAIIDATAAAVNRLVPDLHLPVDLAVTVVARPTIGVPWTEIAVGGTINRTKTQLTGAVDLEAHHVRGKLLTEAFDLARLTSGRVTGSAQANAVFDVRPGGPKAVPIATATIEGWGAIDGAPHTEFQISLASAGERVRASIDARGAVVAKIATNLRSAGELFVIEDATLHVATSDPAHASGGKAPVHGALRADLRAHGELRPRPAVAVNGTVEGTRLRWKDLSVAALHVAVDAGQLPNRPYGKAHVGLVDVVRGEMQLGAITVDASDRADRKIAVNVQSRPKQAPWLIEADALVTPPADAGAGRVVVDLVRHRVRAGNGTDWTGRSGHLELGPQRIALTDLRSASVRGALAVAASYERAGRRRGDLDAHVEARSLSLDNLGRGYRGKVDAQVAVSRSGGAWQGDVQLDGAGLSIALPARQAEVANAASAGAAGPPPAVPPREVTLDAHARASLHRGRLAVTADTTTAGLGGAKLALEADAPRAINDPVAWKRLGRSAIRTGELTLRGVEIGRAAELAGVPGMYAGQLDGTIKISPTSTEGRISARNVAAPALRGQTVNAVLDLAQSAPDELSPALSVTVDRVGKATAQAQLEMPARLLDPAAWARLGRGALRSARVRAGDLQFDPGTLDAFGVTSNLRGRASVQLDVGEAARTVKATISIDELRGDPIAQPVDIHLEAAVGERASDATLSVATRGSPLITLRGQLPLSLAQLLDRGERAQLKATPLRATAKLDAVDAPRLLAVIGRSEVIAGAINGSVELGGTVGKPAAKLNLVATGLKVPPGPGGKPIRTVERLTMNASWDGDQGKLDIDGVESEGGTLKVAANGRLSALRDGQLTVQANKFDLVPLLVFAPGPAGGAAGQLNANLRFTGLDLRTTQVAGELHLLDGRVPIAPTVGTLRRAKLDAIIGDHEIRLVVDGKLGGGTVALNGTVALDGAAPNGGNAKMTLRKVSPIGVVQPEIDADVTATLSRDHDQWRAELVVDHGNVVVPKDRGEKLKPVGAPDDMMFSNGARITSRPMQKQEPTNPIFIAKINLRSTRVESEEFRGLVKGSLELRLDGQSIAMYGGIDADRGDLDLFGRRYQIERAGVHFDGTPDPLLDVRISHEFSEVTTITEVRGRLSKPELEMSSDPGTYSQSQLLGFLLGGEPGGDPRGSSAGNMVAGAGESFVAGKIGNYVRQALPIDIDVLRYEASTASSSAAVTVGSWVSQSLFLAYRQHVSPRADENNGEGEVEYWLSRRVMVQGTVGDRNVNGVDLLWRKRY